MIPLSIILIPFSVLIPIIRRSENAKAVLRVIKEQIKSLERKTLVNFEFTRVKCGRWDLNPHVVSDTRSLVLPVCQFQHFREQKLFYRIFFLLSTVFSQNHQIGIIYKFYDTMLQNRRFMDPISNRMGY